MRSLALAILLVPLTASAGPHGLTVGVSAGWTRDQAAADAGTDATSTMGLWGRLRLSPRLAGQVELVRHRTDNGCATCTVGATTEIRSASALLVVDLADSGRWMPVLVAGFGVDRDDGSVPTKGHHTEGGVGVEYRSEGGFTIGGDVRMGGRSIDSQPTKLLTGGATFLAPGGMQAGEYRSARLTLGLRF